MPHDILPTVPVPTNLLDAHWRIATLLRKRAMTAEDLLALRQETDDLAAQARALTAHLSPEIARAR